MFPKLSHFKDARQLAVRAAQLGWQLPTDDGPLSAAQGSPLAQSTRLGPCAVGNRWCIHPMEGWDGQADGQPSELTLRRWQRFGLSGAKLIWGGEAAAVCAEGRANPRQLIASPLHIAGLTRLRQALVTAHDQAFGRTDDLCVGLQLTHSGRFARTADNQPLPLVAFRHPFLDQRFGTAQTAQILSDEQLQKLIEQYVQAAQAAQAAGFQFVDLKACHGYLMHELLAGHTRTGTFGGSFENRTRLLQLLVSAVQAACPGLAIGVRVSVFDMVPFVSGPAGGQPMPFENALPYRFAFGTNPNDPTQIDLAEARQLLTQLHAWGVAAVNITAGSPYYTPHIQRPAIFPPSDGYKPPEDPLSGVCRLIHAARELLSPRLDMLYVGTGYTYLQDYLPHVAQAVVRAGWIDSVGLGRMVLSYPELPADVLAGRPLARKLLCRTFSECTSGPRQGKVSGCYPLDPFYKQMH